MCDVNNLGQYSLVCVIEATRSITSVCSCTLIIKNTRQASIALQLNELPQTYFNNLK